MPSLVDALMAARINFRLQACVVRRRFAHRSRHDTSFMRRLDTPEIHGYRAESGYRVYLDKAGTARAP